MTEQEAIKILTLNKKEQEKLPNLKEVYAVAIMALEEIKQYRAIGTVEEIIGKVEELKRWHMDKTIKEIKNPFANTSTLVCANCDHKDEYIIELELGIAEYEKIGTAEECREAVEKQREKEPIRIDKCTCPSCGTYNEAVKKRRNTVLEDTVYCWHCGQAMDITRLE